jgi:hypothetical protein
MARTTSLAAFTSILCPERGEHGAVTVEHGSERLQEVDIGCGSIRVDPIRAPSGPGVLGAHGPLGVGIVFQRFPAQAMGPRLERLPEARALASRVSSDRPCGDELSHLRHELGRDDHRRPRGERAFVLGDDLVIGLALVVPQGRLDPCLVPASRKLVLIPRARPWIRAREPRLLFAWRQVQRDEERCGVEVVVARLIDDAGLTVLLRGRIGQRHVDLPPLVSFRQTCVTEPTSGASLAHAQEANDGAQQKTRAGS